MPKTVNDHLTNRMKVCVIRLKKDGRGRGKNNKFTKMAKSKQ